MEMMDSPTPRKLPSHRKQMSSTSSSDSDSLPVRARKRLSFTTLPVIPVDPSTPASKNSTLSAGSASGPNPSTHSPSVSPGVPLTSPRQIRNRSVSSYDSPESYLAQLAAKERRVVELKDEFTRVQAALRHAQEELRRFRGQAPLALRHSAPVKETTQLESKKEVELQEMRRIDESTPYGANTRASMSPTVSVSPGRSPTTDSSRPRRSLEKTLEKMEPRSLEKTMDDQSTYSAMTSLRTPASSSSTPSQDARKSFSAPRSFSLHGLSSIVGSRPDNNPRPSQDSIVEEGANANGNTDSTMAVNGHSDPNSRAVKWPDKSGAIGRVVEELHVQFWGLFEDIKNVTLGEESRASPESDSSTVDQGSDTKAPPPQPTGSSSSGARTSESSSSEEQNHESHEPPKDPLMGSKPKGQPPSARRQRSSSSSANANSYYLI